MSKWAKPDLLSEDESVAGVRHCTGLLQNLQELRRQHDHLGGDQLVQHGHEVSQRELNEDGALLAVLGEVVLAILGRHFAQIVFGLLAGEVALGQPQRSVPVAVRLQILTGIFDLERKDNGIIITPTYNPLTTLYFGS